jgi:hypothetical protein
MRKLAVIMYTPFMIVTAFANSEPTNLRTNRKTKPAPINGAYTCPFVSQVCSSPSHNLKAAQSQQTTYPSHISCFPQMKPETKAKAPVLSKPEEYLDLGVPVEWVEPLQKLGYTTAEKLKELENPGNLANDLNGYKKKNKLDLPSLSPEVVGEWIKS